MNRFLDAESNGGIFIDIGCSERNILTCKVVGRKRNCIMRQKGSTHYPSDTTDSTIGSPYVHSRTQSVYIQTACVSVHMGYL